MIPPRLLALMGLAAVLAQAPACASRTPPSSMPKDAPASVGAPEARPADVTRALQGEPPLPGTEEANAWAGLKPSAEHDHAGHTAHGSSAEGPAHHAGHDAHAHHNHADHGHADAGAAPSTRDGGQNATHHSHGTH